VKYVYVCITTIQKQILYASILNCPMCPFQSTNNNATKQGSRPTRARAHKIYFFLTKILLTRVTQCVTQLRIDLAQYCTLYSQYQLQETVTSFCDILGTTYRNIERHCIRRAVRISLQHRS